VLLGLGLGLGSGLLDWDSACLGAIGLVGLGLVGGLVAWGLGLVLGLGLLDWDSVCLGDELILFATNNREIVVGIWGFCLDLGLKKSSFGRKVQKSEKKVGKVMVTTAARHLFNSIGFCETKRKNVGQKWA